jgi:hypothetical protein
MRDCCFRCVGSKCGSCPRSGRWARNSTLLRTLFGISPMNRQRRGWCGPSFASQMKVLYNRCVHWRVLTVCAGVQQLNDRIRQVLKSSGSTTFSKIVNKWNGHRSPTPYTQTSQSIPTFGTKPYGYGGSHPRPPSPSKSWTSQLPTKINRDLFRVCLALALPRCALVCGSDPFPAFCLSCVPSFSFIFILTPSFAASSPVSLARLEAHRAGTRQLSSIDLYT